MALRAAVAGAAGRMGSRLVCLIKEDPEMELAGALERKGHPALGRDAGEVAGAGKSGVALTDDIDEALRGAQVVLSFSVPEGSLEHARAAARAGMAAVVGTTGFPPSLRAEMESLGEELPLVFAPNMSVGVNVMFRLVAEAARLLGPAFDAEVLEAHHKLKVDAPSGTALRLGEVLAGATGRDFGQEAVFARQGQTGVRPARAIGMQTLRGGDVAGEHTVYFFGTGERLEITHRATSRDNFGLGALRAAKWVVGKPKGLYSMADVLGL
ncbi:MAG: 4-hydroxy-tetrahydrodipicolinate reductase [Nitrospinota bacterium]